MIAYRLDRRLKVLLLLISMVSASCGVTDSQPEQSFALTQILDGWGECGDMCWKGITVGETTASQAFELLTLDGEVDRASLDHPKNGPENYMQFTLNNQQSAGYIVFEQGVAQYLSLRLPSNVNLSELGNMIGDEAFIRVGADAELDCSHVAIISPSYGQEVYGYECLGERHIIQNGTNQLSIDGDLPIQAVAFFEPADYLSQDAEGKGARNVSAEHVRWNGYGTYEVLGYGPK